MLVCKIFLKNDTFSVSRTTFGKQKQKLQWPFKKNLDWTPHVHLFIIKSRIHTVLSFLVCRRCLFPWHQLAPFCQLLLASFQNVLLNVDFVSTLFAVLFRTLSKRSQIFPPKSRPKITIKITWHIFLFRSGS